jgi:large subunit ribosomal protein L10
MAITKEKKQTILAKLKDVVGDSETLVFTGFTGLPVAETTAMRRTLRDRGVGYVVAKKTLIYRALAERAFIGTRPEFDREVAIAYGADAILPAQSVREFEKQYKDHVSILGGVFAGAYKTKEEMTEIASIPALLVLRGMFVNVIASPIQGLVLVLNAITAKKA